jgi:hypothetical protein
VDDDLLSESNLRELLLDSNADPARVDVYLQLRGVEMFWDLDFEVRVVGIVKFLESKLEFALIALSDFAVVGVHLERFLLLVLVRVALFLFPLLVSSHLFVHLSSRLSSVRRL